MNAKKFFGALGIAAAAAAVTPFFANTTENSVDVYALTWSYHKTTDEDGQVNHSINLFSLSDTKAALRQVADLVRTAMPKAEECCCDCGCSSEEPVLELELEDGKICCCAEAAEAMEACCETEVCQAEEESCCCKAEEEPCQE